jgi:hypothetical protein
MNSTTFGAEDSIIAPTIDYAIRASPPLFLFTEQVPSQLVLHA